MTRFHRTARILALVAFIVIGAAPASAQTAISFIAGPAFSSISGDDVNSDGVTGVTGFMVGVGPAIALSPIVTFKPHLAYIQKGFGDADSDAEVKIAYLSVPALVSVSFAINETLGLNLMGGPNFGFQASCTDSDGDSSQDCEDDAFKSTNIGLMGAATLGLPLSGSMDVEIGFGYETGLSSIVDELDVRTGTFYLFVGLSRPIG